MLPTKKIIGAFKSVELLIAFHRNRDGTAREKAHAWSPKNAFAWLSSDPKDQETFAVVKGQNDNHPDVHVKFHPDRIGLVREEPFGWSGIIADEEAVRVRVGNVWVEIRNDGSVKRTKGDDTTFLEEDGSIMRLTHDAEIMVSGDGEQMSRRTDSKIEAFGPEGFISRKKQA